MIPCPPCTAPAGRIRTVRDGDGWRHYYCCLGCGARFDGVERLTDKPRVDRKQVGRMVEQIEKQVAALRAVLL